MKQSSKDEATHGNPALYKQNGERHYLVVIIVANCSDSHYNLPQ